MIEQGATRLRVGAALSLALLVAAVIVQGLASQQSYFGAAATAPFRLALFGTAIALTAGVLVASRARALTPQRVLDLGQLWLGAVILLLCAMEGSRGLADTELTVGIPIPAFAVAVAPLLVPIAPRRALRLGLAVAVAAPLSVALVPIALGLPRAGPVMLVTVTATALVCALVATVGAQMIYRLGTALQTERRLGSYSLATRIGQGGMGEVWRAEHAMLKRPAAIKLIKRGATPVSDESMARFRREAQTIASLHSPHTIELYDFGVTDDGAMFYAMELLEGVDLDTLVTRHGPLPPERVAHILRQACHSLAEAHEAGVVHRDIKPANIFLAQRGRDHDVVKLLDFGLAKVADGPGPPSAALSALEALAGAQATTSADAATSALSDEQRLTLEETVQGTPAYMAPEQALGSRAIDGRADLYALGCVAWWLLVGRDVFVASSAVQVLFAHLHVEPDLPSDAGAKGAPPALEALVMDLLEKDPRDRPQTADEVLARLDEIPVERPWTEARARSWWAAQAQGAGGDESARGGEAAGDTMAVAVTELAMAARDDGDSGGDTVAVAVGERARATDDGAPTGGGGRG